MATELNEQPPQTEWANHFYMDVLTWLEPEKQPRCWCVDGYLPLPDGGGVECHWCRVRRY